MRRPVPTTAGCSRPRVGEVTGRLAACSGGRVLPLLLGRQARAGPPRVGVRLVVAHVSDNLVGVDGAAAGQRVDEPSGLAAFAAGTLLPVERRPPPLALDRPPPVGEPQLRPRVAAVAHEGQVLAAGHRAAGDRERVEEATVAGPLVVERERRALVTNPDDAPLERLKRERGRRCRRRGDRRRSAIAGLQRVRSEGVLDVGEQQLLVLLFVVQAEGDRRRDVGRDCARFQQPANRLVDVAAIGVHLVEGRAGEAAATRPIVLRSDRLVVGVEQKLEGRVERPMVRDVRQEHERLEEPGRVGEVPLGGAGVRHRLDPLVLGRKRRRQLEGARANRPVFVEELHLRTPEREHSNDSARRPER